MIRKSLLALVFGLIFHSFSHAQRNDLDAYVNRLFFHVFKDEPDSAIRGFLRQYIPSLLDKRSAATAKATDRKFALESHGFIFLQHPLIHAPFRNGRIEFDCRRYNDARGVVADNARLWFHFDSQQEAETVFGELVQALKPLSTQNRVFTDNGSMVGDFTDAKAANGFYKVHLFLTTEFLDRTKFQLLAEVASK